MRKSAALFSALLVAAVAFVGTTPGWAASRFAEARIYIEYNSTDNDLGFHVFLDGEDWKSLTIIHPNGTTLFEVTGRGGYAELGLTELFFEGAEPSLDEFPLEELLELFPEGRYRFNGVTIDGARLSSSAILSHAIPAGPIVSAEVADDEVVIRWQPVDHPPAGFPDEDIEIDAYQVIVEPSFQVTLPASATAVTLPEEFVDSLEPGVHEFEVLAIDVSGNQTISSGTFNITDD